jgi:neutral ceramidase
MHAPQPRSAYCSPGNRRGAATAGRGRERARGAGLFLAVVLTAFPAAAADKEFRAGAATANITPPLGELVVGGFNPVPADEVHDELHVRAIVLDDGRTKLAIALCDNVGISRDVFDAAKARVAETLGIPAAQQLYAATHTHSATSARTPNVAGVGLELSDYQKFVVARIADAVRLAHKRLAPAAIGWGSVQEQQHLFNRRWFVVEELERRNPFGGVDQVRMNPGGGATLIRQAGPVDPQVSILSLRHADGRPLAVLANYSLHYVGGVPARTISADYFAVFAEELAELLGEGQRDSRFVGILSNGTSGDVNNIDFASRPPARPPFEKMREVGRQLAQRVAGTLPQIDHQDWVELAARASELELAVRKPSPEMQRTMQEVLAKPEAAERYHPQERVYAERLRAQLEAPETIQVPLQVLRIGELAIFAIPFEVFTETGLELKQRSPTAASFTIELANGSFGYLPTPAQHAVGGYETWLGTNKVEIPASEKIVEQLLEPLEPLRPAPGPSGR